MSKKKNFNSKISKDIKDVRTSTANKHEVSTNEAIGTEKSGSSVINEIEELKYSERKDRFVLIITLTGALLFILRYLIEELNSIFKTFYIKQDFILFGKDFPFGIEHLALPILLTSAFILFGYVVRYCFFEFNNFSSFKNTRLKYSKKADDAYDDLINMVSIHFKLPLFLLLILMVVFTIKANNIISKESISNIVVILFFVVTLIITVKGNLKRFSIIYTIVHFNIYVILAMMILLTGIKVTSNTNGTFDISFSENGEMPAIINLAGNSIPQNIKITVINSDGKTEEIALNTNNDFKRAFVEVYQNNDNQFEANQSKTSQKIVIDKNDYHYSTTVNLKGKINEGDNAIIVTFDVGDKSYKLVDEICISENTISYQKKNMIIKY